MRACYALPTGSDIELGHTHPHLRDRFLRLMRLAQVPNVQAWLMKLCPSTGFTWIIVNPAPKADNAVLLCAYIRGTRTFCAFLLFAQKRQVLRWTVFQAPWGGQF